MIANLEAGRLPDFLLIGAMKAGSTTLHELLSQHPRLFMSKLKEPAFFSRDDRYALGLDWYKALFREARDDQLCAESSTCYSRFPHYGDVVGRIVRHVPSVRLVYLMRHPVDRIYSHYRHRMTERFVRGTAPVLPFEEALAENSEYKDASLYAMQLRKFLEHFPMERLLLLTTDEMEETPAETCARVHEFLGVEQIAPAEALEANRFAERFERSATSGKLERLRRSVLGETLARVLPSRAYPTVKGWAQAAVDKVWTAPRAGRFNEQVRKPSAEVRARLIEEFRAHNAELAELWGRPVPERWHV